MTEIVTSEGKLYLATVIDLFSRRLLGYAMGARHDAELVVASLNMAAATRGGKSKMEIIRCLKRYVAREAYYLIKQDSTPNRSVQRG